MRTQIIILKEARSAIALGQTDRLSYTFGHRGERYGEDVPHLTITVLDPESAKSDQLKAVFPLLFSSSAAEAAGSMNEHDFGWFIDEELRADGEQKDAVERFTIAANF